MNSKFLIFFAFLLIFAGCGKKEEHGVQKPGEIDRFFFLCNTGSRPAVYSYDIKEQKAELFWSSKREKVIEVISSPDGRNVFFLTASDFGRKTIFPYVSKLRIYMIDTDLMKTEKLRDLGNCIQIFTKWTGLQTFRIIYNSFDAKRNTLIHQTKLVFNSNGKLLANERVTFDIVKEKYPVPPRTDEYNTSPDGKIQFQISRSDVLLIDSLRNKRTVYSSGRDIGMAGFSADGSYLVFSALDLALSDALPGAGIYRSSELMLYSVRQNKLMGSWKGTGLKNFLLLGRYLIYDEIIMGKPGLLIHDLNNKRTVDTVAIGKSCGIRNIYTFLN